MKKALFKMKTGKACSSSGLSCDIIKAAGGIGVRELNKVIQEYSDWRRNSRGMKRKLHYSNI